MAIFKPFQAVRPKPEFAAQVAALPYDVMSSAEARVMAADKPLSFLHVDRGEIDLDPSMDIYDPAVYAKAAENLQKLIANGYLIKEETPVYYIYRQIMDDRAQAGIVGCASIDDYKENRIKKHELTRADKEADRIRHVDTLDANTGPIFLTFRDESGLSAFTAKWMAAHESIYDFTAEDGIRHTVWVINDEKMVGELSKPFETVPSFYIADGHHRCASAFRVGEKRRAEHPDYTGEEEFNYFLAVLFPADELKILDYNRVVKDLNGLSKEEFLDKCRACFEVSELVMTPEPANANANANAYGVSAEKVCGCPKRTSTVSRDLEIACPNGTHMASQDPETARPQEKHSFGMYLDGKWYALKAKAGTFDESDPVGQLDVTILQKNLLTPVLGIGDPRTDERISFVGGIRGLGELVRLVDGGAAVAFAMYPTTLDDLMNIADAGAIMPPKSTWFEPKLRSGLFIHELS